MISRQSLATLFIGMTALLLCSAIGTSWGAEASDALYPKTNLLLFLKEWKTMPRDVGLVCSLEPEWVGTVSNVYTRDPLKIYEKLPGSNAQNIRFSHLMVNRDSHARTNIVIIRGRMKADGRLGSHLRTEAPRFMSNLPSAKAVSESQNLNDLRKMFGPQHGWTDGWGDSDEIHWTEGWTCFTVESTSRLRYLDVFAHVSGPRADKADDRGARIEILRVAEGSFGLANPNSLQEREQFKTGEGINTVYNAARAKAREIYPQTLRKLVEARETPDDSDSATYKRALDEVRKNPSPQLFREFAEWVGEGTCEIRLMLETLLFDNHLNLERWQKSKRREALRALVDSLPSVKTSSDLETLLVIILRAEDGGKIKATVPGTHAVIDIEVGWSGGARYGSSDISSNALERAAKECVRILRDRYADLR